MIIELCDFDIPSAMSNEIYVQKIDYYLSENDHCTNVKIDQNVIISASDIHYVVRHIEFPTECNSSVNDEIDWYPCVNSYYPYTEDVDALGRVNHLLGAEPSLLRSFTSTSEVLSSKTFPYSERDAQIQYLLTTPLSFLILGKPEIGEKELGKKIADDWRSVYIEPEILIEDEIRSGSRAGKCIEFNLRCGRAIGIDIILRLLEKRIKSETAAHRGVVVCGLPVIANDLYKEDPISTMSAIFTAKDFFSDTLTTALDQALTLEPLQISIPSRIKSDDDSEEEGFESQEMEPDHLEPVKPISSDKSVPARKEFPIDVGDDVDIGFFSDISVNYEDQLIFLFNLLKEPLLIIYMMCCTEDVINTRNNCRFSVYSNCEVQTKNGIVDARDEMYKYSFLNYIDTRHLVRVPRNFPANVCTQLDNFHSTAVKVIEQRILSQNPQYFIKVDARNNADEIFQIIKKKLTILPHYKVALPNLLNRLEIENVLGEDESEHHLKVDIDYSQYYKVFSLQDAPGQFTWNWSQWGTKCPVSMKEGSYKQGDVDCVVHFMNKIFFLANDEALIKFYRNPRPYLLPPFPKPLCKIYIFGPHASGKSTVAKCLSYLLDGTVLLPNEQLKHILKEKEGEQKERIRVAAVNEAVRILTRIKAEEADKLEDQRIQQIKEWISFATNQIQTLIQLLEELNIEQNTTKFEISSFPMAMEKKSLAEIETETTLAIRKIRDFLESAKIPFSRDVNVLGRYLTDKKKLLQYLPQQFRKKIQPLPVSSSDEFVVNFSKKAVAHASIGILDVTSKNLASLLMASMRDAEIENIRKGYTRGGWIMDDMICDVQLLEDLYPDFIADDIILLTDTSPNFTYSVDRYANYQLEIFRDFQQVFLSLGKTDIAWPVLSQFSNESSKVQMIHNIVSEIIDNDQIYVKDPQSSNRSENYRNEIKRFYRNWENVKDYFIKNGKEIIEVDVVDKTFPQLLKEVIRLIESKYTLGAQKFTQEDRAEEVRHFSNRASQLLEISEGLDAKDIDDSRFYGDTYHFCPVTYRDMWVLWKGKEDFAAKLGNKVYLLSSEDDLKKFLQTPNLFISGKIPTSFPPPRICVIGAPMSGKTKLSQAIAFNYGLKYVNFFELVRHEYKLKLYNSFFELWQNSKINPTVHNYLHVGEPLPEIFYKNQLWKFWFDLPVKEVGFVLDDFPKRKSDISMMVKHKLIPDIVLVLSEKADTLKEAMIETLFNDWKIKHSQGGRNEIDKAALLEWEEKRQKRFKELLDERRERRFAMTRKTKDKEENDTAELDSEFLSGNLTVSQISFNSVEEQKDIDEINKILDVEFPEIVVEQPNETYEEAKEKLETQVSDMFQHELNAIETMKKEAAINNIPFGIVPLHLNFFDQTFRHALFITDKVKNRNESFFERCYDITMELAETLLSEGYFYLSCFGRLCPVQYHENNNPFHMYEVALRNNNVFPVVHRNYIYFIFGLISLGKFKGNPLLYVNVASIEFPVIPFTMAIIGPPKSGKTILAERIGREFGLKVITRGQAIRNILSNVPNCSLATQMESILRKGWELTDELVLRSVEAGCLQGDEIIQGKYIGVIFIISIYSLDKAFLFFIAIVYSRKGFFLF